jgi:transcriptional regulator with XRE-family HTH domain
MLDIREAVTKLRTAAGLTRKEFCEAVGIKRSCLSGYETGRRKPRPDYFMKLEAFAKEHKLENILQ